MERSQSGGVYHSWTDCQLQIKGYEGALYKSFDTREEAEQAFASSAFHYVGKECGEERRNSPATSREL